MHKNFQTKALSVTLLLLALLPLLCLLIPNLPSPSLYLLLPLLDHTSSAIFATRYLTFLSGYPPYLPCNLYPFLLPYAPLLQLSYSLFHTTTSIKHTILPYTGLPAPIHNACQARFTLFISTNAVVILFVLQVIYNVPAGVSHYLGLVLPTLVIVAREGCSPLTVMWITSLAKFGNVASLMYLVITAVQALREGISLERLLLAPRGDFPDFTGEGEGRGGSPLLGKDKVSDVSESIEVVDGDEIADDGAAKT